MKWDLYAQQPLILKHPENLTLAVAGVCRINGGIVWWSADYLISLNMPGGQPGSGFANYAIYSEPEFVDGDNAWHVYTDNAPDGRVYRFYQPDEVALRLWQNYKQYVPSISQLAELTAKQFEENHNVADN